MSTQQALALPSLPPSSTVVINPRCSLRIEADQRVIVVAGLPMHHYRVEDAVAEVLCDGVPGGVWLRPADGRCAGFLPIGAHYSALPRALCRWRDGSAQSRGRVAARPTAYLRESHARLVPGRCPHRWVARGLVSANSAACSGSSGPPLIPDFLVGVVGPGGVRRIPRNVRQPVLFSDAQSS